MATLRMLVGLPASGKSTYAKELMELQGGGWKSVNYDTLRHFTPDGEEHEYHFSRQSERAIELMGDQIAEEAARNGLNIVIDNTNLTIGARRHWGNFADAHGMKFEVENFNATLDECVNRNSLRTGWRHVPRPVIERMALMRDRVRFPDQRVVIVDVDGTLADCGHRQKYVTGACWYCNGRSMPIGGDVCRHCNGSGQQKKDWKQFFAHVSKDTPIIPTVRWVQQLHDAEYYICIVSGRALDQTGQATVEWLEDNEVPFDRIFMRSGGDNRDDTIVKKEIFDAMKRTLVHPVEFVIDDRPKVIRMWREQGLKVYDVGDGIEF